MKVHWWDDLVAILIAFIIALILVLVVIPMIAHDRPKVDVDVSALYTQPVNYQPEEINI